MSNIKIGIIGCQGRMGKALVGAVLDQAGVCLVGGTEMATSADVGAFIKHPKTGEPTAITITSDTEKLMKEADVVLDFTCPTATVLHTSLAEKHGTSLIIGTTGLNKNEEKTIAKASQKIPIVYASNYSLGVNLLLYLTRKAATLLDEYFDIEILEMHHRHKIDAPSGTALSLGEQAALGRNVILKDVSDRDRDGITAERKRGHIGFASLRGGNVAGEHTVSFNADDERIELTHKATDRTIFARGAVKAAFWVADKTPALYDMSDVLNLPKN
jgi:4-hydroxy-tetrahydrodipicolinate reductase